MAVHPAIQTNSHPSLLDPCGGALCKAEATGVFWLGGRLDLRLKFQPAPTPLWLQLYSYFHPAAVQLAGFVLLLLSPAHFSGRLNPWSSSRSSHLKTRAGAEKDISPPLFRGGADCCWIDKAARVESKSNCSRKWGFEKMPWDQG